MAGLFDYEHDMMLEEQEQNPTPSGEIVLQLMARARDTNMFGDVYAGWLVDQMDQAAEMVAAKADRGRCATVSIEALDFTSPIPLGARVEIYAEAPSIGRTSISVPLEAWVRHSDETLIKVTQGRWVLVSIAPDGHIKAL